MISTIIVDDEILSRIGIQTFLEGEEGIQVLGIFGTAEEGMEFLRRTWVDIVITDIEMAEINGLEFIQMIRKEDVADGVIIVSCHDDFAYAQEAISKGTDSYLLKYSLSKETLVEEVRKVYQKHRNNRMDVSSRKKVFSEPAVLIENGIYQIGVLRVKAGDIQGEELEKQLDGSMLVHLLDEIVSRYQMGTLFSPYNKELFILFQYEKGSAPEARRQQLCDNLSAITKNMQQYISGSILYGISEEYTELAQTREQYTQAAAAIEMSFYDKKKDIFAWRKMDEAYQMKSFKAEGFGEMGWLKAFETELGDCLQKAYFQHVTIQTLKEQLIGQISQLIFHIMQEHCYSEMLKKKWNSEIMFISAISSARDVTVLQKRLLEMMEEFRRDIYSELENDELSNAFSCIEQNLNEKISLQELADMCCMSVPSFCKKFKERTGMTLVQYMNGKRIEKAKQLLKNKNYSLWEVAELAGFSNANYLIRVFKKVTGQTVSEYRKQYGITEILE